MGIEPPTSCVESREGNHYTTSPFNELNEGRDKTLLFKSINKFNYDVDFKEFKETVVSGLSLN